MKTFKVYAAKDGRLLGYETGRDEADARRKLAERNPHHLQDQMRLVEA